MAEASSVHEIKAAMEPQFGHLTDAQMATVGLGRAMVIKKTTGHNRKSYFKLSGLRCPGMLPSASGCKQIARLATEAELAATPANNSSDSE